METPLKSQTRIRITPLRPPSSRICPVKLAVDINSAHFVFSGIVQVTRQVEDGRVLNLRKLGPSDSFGDISLLIGMHSLGTFTALTSGLLLQLQSEELKPILESRPELMESLSQSATKAQQFVAMFDKAAIQPVAIEPRDLLSRIRTFFHLEQRPFKKRRRR